MKLSIIETPQFNKKGVHQKVQVGVLNTKTWMFTPFIFGHKVYFGSHENFKNFSLL